MSQDKNVETSEKNTYTKQQEQLPLIKKIPVDNKILHRSNSYLTPIPYGNSLKTSFPKNSRVISYGSNGINIHTKFYRINDYLSRAHKDLNLLQTTNTFLRNKSTNDNTDLKKSNEIQTFNVETGMVSTNYFPKKKLVNVSTNSARMINDSFRLNRQNKINYLRSESFGFNEGKVDNENKINNFIIKKLSNYNTKLLKNSRYFSNTKYINGPKNKNKHISKAFSTKNISFTNITNASTLKKTMNDIRVEELLNKQKNLEENEKKTNLDNNVKKTKNIKIENETENRIPSPIFYDFIPIILQHLKRKEIEEETNKENDWIYSQINGIYNKNSKAHNKYTTLKSKNNKFLFENPIIRYLFLEKTLYNIKHSVKFIDVKNQEQLEQRVLKIIKDEYTNFKETNFKFNINDFITYGYEFDPKLLVKFQQNMQKSADLHYLIQKLDKGIQKNISTKFSIPSHKEGFFTTNKSETKNIDKAWKSKQDKSKDDMSSSEGILSKIFKNQNIVNKIRKFEGLKIKGKKNEKNNIEFDSNKQNISKLILKDSKLNYSSEKNKDENNDQYLDNSDFHIKNINDLNNQESEKDSIANADIIPQSLFQNDKLRQTQPIMPTLQRNNFTSLKKKLLDDDYKRISLILQKDTEKKPESNKPSLFFAKNQTVHSPSSKDNIRHIINKPKFRRFSIKKNKKKKKTNTNNEKDSKELNEPSNDVDLDKNNGKLATIEEVKNDNNEKKEIKDINEYQQYKKEMIEKNKLDKKSKENIINEIIKQEERQSSILNPNSRVNEMKYSSKYKSKKSSNFDSSRLSKKFGRDEFIKMGEKKQVTQLKKLKEDKQEEEIEEKDKEDDWEDDDDYFYYDDDYSDSIFSSEFNDINEFDFSKEFDYNKDVMNKNWMDNSPNFKNRIVDFNKKKREVISESSEELADELSKNEKIYKLSDKMKLLYDRIKRRRKIKKKKKKKSSYYNFAGVDLKNIEEIEKKKKIYLFRLKEDIKYKITEGKYHLIEMENFKNFEKAMIQFRLKDTSNEKKVKLYIRLIERYLRFYQMELDKKEKEKNDEDRINKFLRALKQDVYETLPLVKEIKGRYCHSIDYFQELYQLSEIHGFLM